MFWVSEMRMRLWLRVVTGKYCRSGSISCLISCDLTREQVLACRALDRCATTNTERERQKARDRKEICVLKFKLKR